MNWFILTAAILYLFGSLWEYSSGNNSLAIIYLAYGVANVALLTINK